MLAPFLVLWVLAILAYLPNFFIPFVHGDEAGWWVLAREVWSGNLYVNLTDTKPPLLMQLQSLMSLGDTSWLALRFFLSTWIAVGGYLFFRALKLWYGNHSRIPLLAAALFVLTSSWIENGTFCAERMALPFVLAGFWLGSLERFQFRPVSDSTWTRAFLFGVCASAAINLKQPLVLLFIPSFLLFCQSFKRSVQALIGSVVGFVLFFWLCWAVTGVPFSVIYEETYGQNLQYTSHGGEINDILNNFLYALAHYGFLLALCLPMIFRPSNRPRTFLFLACLLTACAFAIGRRFYQTYYLYWLPLLAFGAAVSFNALWERRTIRNIFLSILFLQIVALQGWTIYRQVTNRNPAWNQSIQHLVKEIENNSSAEDTIWLLNSTHVGYAASHRKPAVKHIYFHQTLGHIDLCQAPDEQMKEPLENELPNYERLLSDLQRNLPQIVFWTQNRRHTCANRLQMERFPRLNGWIQKNYTLKWEDELGKFFVLRPTSM